MVGAEIWDVGKEVDGLQVRKGEVLVPVVGRVGCRWMGVGKEGGIGRCGVCGREKGAGTYVPMSGAVQLTCSCFLLMSNWASTWKHGLCVSGVAFMYQLT